jgi:hypothetical protein
VVFHDYWCLRSYCRVAFFFVRAFLKIYNHDETEEKMAAVSVPQSLLLQALSVDVFPDEHALLKPEEVDAKVVGGVVHNLHTRVAEELQATPEGDKTNWQFARPPKQLQLQLKRMLQHDHAFVLHNIVPWPLLDAVEKDAIAIAAAARADEEDGVAAPARPTQRYLLIRRMHLAVAPHFQREDLPS